MKKSIKIVSKILACILALSCLFGVTEMNAYADSGNCHFNFPKREINLAPGDEYHMYVWASDWIHDHVADYPTFSIYMVPDNPDLGKSSKTYCWSDFNCGNSYVDIYIGEDEVNTGFTLYFYVDGLDEWDNINVHIVDPLKSDVPSTKNNAKRIQMGEDPLPVSKSELKKMVNFGDV